jgi:hypothetical protein
MMDETEMRGRCPRAVPLGRALLEGHQLYFPRFSQGRKCAVAGVLQNLKGSVWGRLWEVDPGDLSSLDKAEGFRPDRPKDENSYNRVKAVVLADGNATRLVEADLYHAIPTENPGLPSHHYLGLIIRGAAQAELPAAYIDWLRDSATDTFSLSA